MEFAGRHLLGEMHGATGLDGANLERVLTEAVQAGGGTLLRVFHHAFDPHGATTVAVLGESHASIHTFPEHDALFFDIFTCGTADPERMAAVLVERLRPTRHSWHVVHRGAQAGT